MQNLCGDPKVHFLAHIHSGKRLIDNPPQRCVRCDGFGYPKSTNHDFIGKRLDVIAQYYIEGDLMNTCEGCNGTGKNGNS